MHEGRRKWCHWLGVRDDSARFQRVKVPSRSGLLGPGSYSKGGQVPIRRPSKQRRTNGGPWVRRQVCRPKQDPACAGKVEGRSRPRKVRSGCRTIPQVDRPRRWDQAGAEPESNRSNPIPKVRRGRGQGKHTRNSA